MSNEEKAQKIADFLYFKLSHIDYNTLKRELLEMAHWKDEQFRQMVKDYIELAYSNGDQAHLLEDLLTDI